MLPAAWVAATLQPSITIGKGPMRYGHHWWAGQVQHAGRSLPWTAGVGNGGQRLFVVPEFDLAVGFTAWAYNSEQIGPIESALLRQIVATCRPADRAGPCQEVPASRVRGWPQPQQKQSP